MEAASSNRSSWNSTSINGNENDDVLALRNSTPASILSLTPAAPFANAEWQMFILAAAEQQQQQLQEQYSVAVVAVAVAVAVAVVAVAVAVEKR